MIQSGGFRLRVDLRGPGGGESADDSTVGPEVSERLVGSSLPGVVLNWAVGVHQVQVDSELAVPLTVLAACDYEQIGSHPLAHHNSEDQLARCRLPDSNSSAQTNAFALFLQLQWASAALYVDCSSTADAVFAC